MHERNTKPRNAEPRNGTALTALVQLFRNSIRLPGPWHLLNSCAQINIETKARLSPFRWAAGLAMLAMFGCAETNNKPAEAPAGGTVKHAPRAVATRVEVARIETTRATLRLVRPGEVEGFRQANLAAALGGLIEQLKVKAGQRVRRGGTVARVDASMLSAQRDLTAVELKDAEREFGRLQQLGSSVAKARVDAAETRLARAQAQHRIAELQLGRATVRAPFGALVAEVHVEQGEVTPPGAPIARIVQTNPALVSVSVSDRDVGSLQRGGKAVVTAAGSGTSLEGQIDRIEPTADLKTRSFIVKVRVANKQRVLRPGMIANVEFRQVSTGEQLILPQEFVVTRLEGNGVFVVDEHSKARWRPLTLGQLIGKQVVVDSGLRPGEHVVVVGHRSLSDQDPVIVARQGVCCTSGRVQYPSVEHANARPTMVQGGP